MKGIVSEDWIRMLQEEKNSLQLSGDQEITLTLEKDWIKKTVNVQNTELC